MQQHQPFVAPISLDARWNAVGGIDVDRDGRVRINPDEYFFVLERPAWLLIDWEFVRSSWSLLRETPVRALEQVCLEFVRSHASSTTDPAVVLSNAEKVFTYLFTPERLRLADLPILDETALCALREASTLATLNRVRLDGHIETCGPAWMIADVAQMVYGFNDAVTRAIDEQLHAEQYAEILRGDSLRAHTAFCGRPVHACRPDSGAAGKAILEYGTDIEVLQAEVEAQRIGWRQAIYQARKQTQLVDA